MYFVRIGLLLSKRSPFLKESFIRYGIMTTLNVRNFQTVEVSKNLEFITKETTPVKITDYQLLQPQNKPLVILLSWMLAKNKHIRKFAEYYVDYGFDILRISISPWQLLWPTKGTQAIASEVVKFLDLNQNYAPLLVHGFSVGGYQWGEVLVLLNSDRKHYQPILDRIVGQVWDSAADISEISFGFPLAVFPNNLILQNAMRQYMQYHMRTFDKVATCHYVRSSQLFHSDLVKAPALIFLSKTDPVGAERSNLRLKEDWESLGIKVFWKCWDESPHVGHYHHHREEYVEHLNSFINFVGLTPATKKLQAKL